MIVIPAIDLKDGRCVRLRQGQLDDETVYSTDATELARRWESEGAQLLHVVDLNGAVQGQPQNRAVIENILKAVKIPVHVGGGVRDLPTIDAYLSAGAARVVLGTAICGDMDLLQQACQRYPGQLIVGVDAKNGKLAVRGWTRILDEDALQFAGRLKGYPIYAIIYTDIGRDGMLSGPNIEGLKRMAAATPVSLIASGGITRLEDLRQIRVLGPHVIGAIVGKALYEGMINLRDAMAAVA
jgi:phosphoribosylformimino-5-aminoimidazole carboxamide ribotide isomerase